ncbi:hypothetical protein N5I05_04555 [Acinetobacter johnsonii]|uniref:hypothetical protein n=1 Tax=Acinetobacter johnsonii TaxID=40214 RepID=UPI00244C33B0|nr:hypothetical protein [Acinetobacter johnsonii]MDH1697824.1 hypothetical protein [Acinetobacter johnsonii]
MNPIEQLGGYERAKIIQGSREMGGLPYDLDLEDALLQYRRQHNIFEIGDKVVSKENNGFVYTVITVDGGLGRLKNVLFDHVYPLHDFRHATGEEIKAGIRLEVESEN